MTGRTTPAAVTFAAMLAVGLNPQAATSSLQTAGSQDRVAALKQAVQEGQARLRQYEWIETTIISLKGEEKARKQNRCYYGADGKVQKVAVEDATEEQASGGRPGRGRRGARVKEKVIEKKKGEMEDYMERAAGLIHLYVPPTPPQIQAAKDAGRVAVRPKPDGQVTLEISHYVLEGDSLTINLDTSANRLLGLGVSTYLDTPEDPVTLAVQMGALPDGAVYAARTTLDAKAKDIRVVIENSGHRPVTR